MNVRWMKYSLAFVLPGCTAMSFSSHGFLTFLPVVFAFVIIPIADALVGADSKNREKMESELARTDRWYDMMIYLTVPVQVGMLIWFLFVVDDSASSAMETVGRVLSMGLMCGVFGINVAHELGHRSRPYEKVMAKMMLSTSLYMHFFIEHNRGHHRNVGTPEDAASARPGEDVYSFYLRTLTGSFASAWRIVSKERSRRGQGVWSLGNEMIQYLFIEIGICVLIGYVFGPFTLLMFLIAALIGMLLLESVNYIEHYGLKRNKVSEHRYEEVQAWHSWNSDFVIGRLVLFELTRHSDHHWDPSKPYQVLDSMPRSRELPAGYPAMIITALIPPLWFSVMDKRLAFTMQ